MPLPLFAPKAGEQTRRELKTYARKTEEDLLEKAKEMRAALDESIERGKSFKAGRRRGGRQSRQRSYEGTNGEMPQLRDA